MRARQIRDMSNDELENALADRRQELFNLRFQSATGALENSARLRTAKREIARILTVRGERETQQAPSKQTSKQVQGTRT